MVKKKRHTIVDDGYKVYCGTGKMSEESFNRQKYSWGQTENSQKNIRILFGDESSFKDIVSYGIVGVNNSNAKLIEQEINRVFEGKRLHCNEIFNNLGREKSEWRNFTDEQIWVMVNSILQILNRYQAVFSVGVVHYDTYPKKISGGIYVNKDVTQAHMYGFACQGALSGLERIKFINPHIQTYFFPDEQKTIQKFWFDMRIGIQRFFTHKYVQTLKKESGENPILLDIADLFTYITSHSLTKKEHNKRNKFRELYRICNPVRIDQFWCDNENKLSLEEFYQQISEQWF
ncbi:MAG: hypothetical protein JEZ00_16860 [Anaerolineaceae bacterium]|nr:hypothetical protein [Anaerolineaceae bacterium]